MLATLAHSLDLYLLCQIFENRTQKNTINLNAIEIWLLLIGMVQFIFIHIRFDTQVPKKGLITIGSAAYFTYEHTVY